MGNNRMLEVWRRDGRSMLVEIPILDPARFAQTVCPHFAAVEFIRQIFAVLDVEPEWFNELSQDSFNDLWAACREENPEFVSFARQRMVDMINQPEPVLANLIEQGQEAVQQWRKRYGQ